VNLNVKTSVLPIWTIKSGAAQHVLPVWLWPYHYFSSMRLLFILDVIDKPIIKYIHYIFSFDCGFILKGQCIGIEPIQVQVNIKLSKMHYDILGCKVIAPLKDKYGMFV